MKKISFLILILFQINLYSDIKTEIKVRLFSSYNSNNTIVSPVDGTYYLLSENNDGSIIDTIAVIDADNDRRSSLNITNKDGFLLVNQSKKHLGRH